VECASEQIAAFSSAIRIANSLAFEEKAIGTSIAVGEIPLKAGGIARFSCGLSSAQRPECI
jgi:hypothetical protein